MRVLLHGRFSKAGPGLSHTLSEWLGGVAIASMLNASLVYQPLVAGHGFGDTLDRFLWLDERGLTFPLQALHLNLSTTQEVSAVGYSARVCKVATAKEASETMASHDSSHALVLWLPKQQAFPPFAAFARARLGRECASPRPYLYSGLWLRERFWRAVHRAHTLAPRWDADVTAAGVPPVLLCVHVRRGDISRDATSSRFIDIPTVLAQMRAVRIAIGKPLEAPHVEVHLLTETGFTEEDVHAVRVVAPQAEIHRGSSADSTLDALLWMAHSDILIMGSSGFSWWGGLMSCGLKLGANGMGSVPLPMRHNITLLRPLDAATRANLTTAQLTAAHEALFATHVPTLRRLWREYWVCRIRPACAKQKLCAVDHVTNPCWVRSELLHRGEAARSPPPHDLAGLWQWRRPPIDVLLNASGTPRRIVLPPERVVLQLHKSRHRDKRHLGAWAELARSPRGAHCVIHRNGTVGPLASTFTVDVGCLHPLWRQQLDTTMEQLKRTFSAAGLLNRSRCQSLMVLSNARRGHTRVP